MSFFQMNMITTQSPNFDERQWVKRIRQNLDEELEEETEIPVTIFGVPKALLMIDPESYIPHQVSIGPYHYLRPELYDMERYKVAATKRFQKELQNSLKFEHIVEHLIQHELRIRASYHRPLSFEGETLAWMMAVDTAFLFEFLQVCGVREGKVLTRIPSTLAHLVDLSGNKTAHNAILRDIMMLENQIPFFVVRMLVELQLSSLEKADGVLHDMLTGVCNELSPFKTVKGPNKIEVRDCAHFLDFLYQFVVPKLGAPTEIFIEVYDNEGEAEEGEKHSFAKSSHMGQANNKLLEVLSTLVSRPMQLLKSIIFSKALKLLVRLPWIILSRIPIINMLKEPLEHVFGALSQGTEKKDDSISNNINFGKHPVLEEITIPSVTQLVDVGVQFLPTSEGISTINFDPKTRIFHIPIIDLTINSEVVLRNLVAYEACSGSGPLVLSRYTELMNGMIDTEEDARFLCQQGIIINHLKSEKEVADLWNGMCKSIRLTKVPSLDKVIGDVNKYYDGKWKVKFGKFMKKYVFGSWKILTFLAAVVLMLLVILQAFCQVYSCGRIFNIEGFQPTDR